MNFCLPHGRLIAIGAALLITCVPLTATSTPEETVEIHFKDHRFTPQKVAAPAGVPLVLRVVNDSAERIEFESFKLNREKVVEAGQTLVLHLPALKPGAFDFYDDFHSDVPEGQILAK